MREGHKKYKTYSNSTGGTRPVIGPIFITIKEIVSIRNRRIFFVIPWNSLSNEESEIQGRVLGLKRDQVREDKKI